MCGEVGRSSVWDVRIVCEGRGGVPWIGCSVRNVCVGAWELRVVCYMVYYAAFFYLKLVFCALLSCVLSWAYTGFLRGVFVFFRTWGRVLVFCFCSALGWLLLYMF